MQRRFLATTAVGLAAALAFAACGDDKGASDTTAAPATTAAAETTAAAADTTAAPASTVDPKACAAGNTITDGRLTVATGTPAFAPWVIDDKPESGQGYESAVAYAVAEKMGFAKDAVIWMRTGFDEAIAPGPKSWDFNIQQYTINADREKVVSFSDPYYVTNQALVAFADNKFATAKSISELKGAKLGAAVGTTSLDFIQNVIKPEGGVQVYDDNAAAKAALEAKQIDGLLVDLPTSGGIAYGELTNGTVVGQFVRQGDEQGDQLGMLFEKDNPLVACVDAALAQLKADGTLDQIETQWLKGDSGIPVISRD